VFRLMDEPIAPMLLEDARAGAHVVFEGRVRNHNDGRVVTRLEYEAYREMAQREGETILEEARKRFETLACACSHRVGTLEIGEIAIRVDVVAAHRGVAFQACEWIVDEVKRRVPIWKKEHYESGDSGWVNQGMGSPEG
jgi:molybdopterin synthase catalytic subunit